MLGNAMRRRKRWRSGLLKAVLSGAHPDTDTKETGFSRVQGAADFVQADLHTLLNLQDNKWIKSEQTGHLSDFIAHIVAASYASPDLYEKTPVGYYFLPCAFPHPNGGMRGRTELAKSIATCLGPHLKHQIFGIITWRYHNTSQAWEKLKPMLQRFVENEDMSVLRAGVETMYGESDKPSYLFSTGDGIRSSSKAGTWRAAALDALDSWWAAAQLAASILEEASTTPAAWHEAFLTRVVPKMKYFGMGYWAKFVFGDIGHITGEKVNLDEYTMIGVGAFTMLEKWGLKFPSGALAAQRTGLEAVRELRACVNKVLESGRHAAMQSAREEANLVPLTAYDVQVQLCECKRGFSMPARIRATRARLSLQVG